MGPGIAVRGLKDRHNTTNPARTMSRFQRSFGGVRLSRALTDAATICRAFSPAEPTCVEISADLSAKQADARMTRLRRGDQVPREFPFLKRARPI